eukprot:1160155-Pelagomonas_calceolata.AAC.1
MSVLGRLAQPPWGRPDREGTCGSAWCFAYSCCILFMPGLGQLVPPLPPSAPTGRLPVRVLCTSFFSLSHLCFDITSSCGSDKEATSDLRAVGVLSACMPQTIMHD